MSLFPFLEAYGLGDLLTQADDPAFWEAALRQHWRLPEHPECMVEALRFDIGRRLAENEQPQGEENEQWFKMRGLVDIEEWCFERIASDHLQIKKCPDVINSGAVLWSGMGLSALMSGQNSMPLSQLVFEYLGISRPSQGVEQGVVYSAYSAPGVGQGAAHLWRRQGDGSWKQTDQKISWWIT
jgi:hypothetical protein